MEVYWLVMICPQFRLGVQVMSLTSHAVHVGNFIWRSNVSRPARDASARTIHRHAISITPRSIAYGLRPGRVVMLSRRRLSG